MSTLFKGLRPTDYILTVLLVAVAALLAVANMTASANDPDLVHAVESSSWLMVPVFVAAVLPILFRRRYTLAAIGISFAIVAASVPMFGWVTRCGFALPLAAAFAYAVARFVKGRENHLIGLFGIAAMLVAALALDSSTGAFGALPIAVGLAAVSYAVGLFVQSRSTTSAATPTVAEERITV